MRFGRGAVVLALILIVPRFAAAQQPTAEALEERLTATAKRMDAAYREAGSRVDIARFDGDELQRQGHPYPAVTVEQIRVSDQSLRSQWMKLDATRSAIQSKLARAIDGKGGMLLEITNLTEGGSGESGWFALRHASIVLQDGRRIDIAAKDFKGGTYRESYAYQCEPSPMVAVYGKQSSNWAMRTLVDLPKGVQQGDLEISGLDQDKPGIVPISVAVNGVQVFSGANQFKKVGWSEKRYKVPAQAWSSVVERVTPEAVSADLDAWDAAVTQFDSAAHKTADAVDAVTRAARQNLVWQKRQYPEDWWSRGFLRGICYESDSTLGPAYNRPWFFDNKEYVAKAFDAAKVNLVYAYPGGDTDAATAKEYREFAKYNDLIGTPVVSVYWPGSAPKAGADGSAPASFYTSASRANEAATQYLNSFGSAGTDSAVLRGIAIDEPRIDDYHHFSDVPDVLEAFRAYLKRREPALSAAGITIDASKPPVLKCTSDADKPAWMEWQYFKMEYVTQFYGDLSRSMAVQHRLQLLVAQDYSTYQPQVTAYPGYGAQLPLVCTDLYNDGGITEAFVADLLRSVCKGKSVLVTGAGYSGRTPSHFYRTQANAMMRADGILTWIYTYAAKYRYPYFFIRPDMKDDRGRQLIDSWRPEYWDIFSRVYNGMANAEPYLVDTQSTAQIGVLYSLRTVIAESAQGSPAANHSQRNCILAYNTLQDLHVPVEACMVEGLTPDKLARFRVLFLIDGQALAATECELLSQWVRDGGTLVVSGQTSLRDEWGRPAKQFALEPILGAGYISTATGQAGFSAKMPRSTALVVSYNSDFTYSKVKPQGATVLAQWPNGDAALLNAKIGKGQTFLITADRPGEYACDSDPSSGRYKWNKPGFPELFQAIARANVAAAPVEVLGAPNDVEVQIRRKGEDWIIQLLDWHDDRTVKGLKLAIRLPGKYQAVYPMDGVNSGEVQSTQPLELRPLMIHDMVVLKRAS